MSGAWMGKQTFVNRPKKPDPERRLRDVVCPQCNSDFRLRWNDWSSEEPTTLRLRGCPSGGIYDVSIACPHCDYVEEL